MNRFDLIRKKMKAHGADVLVLGTGAHMKWLVGFAPHPDERTCFLLVTQNDAAFVMPALNAEDVKKNIDLPMWKWSDSDGPMGAINDAVSSLKIPAGANVRVDETMRTDFTLRLMEVMPHAKFKSISALMSELRMIKDEDEIQLMKAQALIADEAILRARSAIKAGMSEQDLGQVIKDYFASQGASTEFCIVANAKNAAYPHHHTGKDLIQADEAFLIDIGCRTGNYSSDITRMQAIGKVSAEYQKVHGIVEAAVQAALAVAKVGAKASDVDNAARGVIEDAGYGEYFVHRTGHGMGLEGHEAPNISASDHTILQAGMVFSIEPGIYIPGKFGIRLEDIIVLREDGPEILSELSREVAQL